MLDAEPAWMMHPGMGSRRRARIDIGKGSGPTPGGEYGTLGGLDAGHEVVGGVPEGSGRFRPRPENEFVTPEIEAEGYAREVIRRIQQMRKDLKLNVEQFVDCTIAAEPRLSGLLETWKDHISSEVRAKTLSFVGEASGSDVKEWEFTGQKVVIGITPIQ